MSKLPDPIRSLSGRIRALEERVRKLTNASPFNNSGLAVIDAGQTATDGSVVIPGGGLLLVDGGDVVMLDEAPSAQELFRLGMMERGDRGIQMRRQDGSLAFQIRDVLGLGGPQAVGVYDSQGAQIFGTGLFSAGLGAPYIPIDWHPVDYTSGAQAQSTSSATFAATHEHRGFKQNNVVWPQFMVQCSDATTAAEVQLFSVTGGAAMTTQAGDPLTITVPAGTTTFALFEFADFVHLPGAYGLPVRYEIQARVTAGAGSVSVAPVRSVGVRDQLSAH